MDAEFWHERWRNNQIGFHQDCINPWLERHWHSLGIETGSTVFVPLCGKSRDMLWLLEQGYRVTGVEISDTAVEAFFSESGLVPEVHEQAGSRVWRHAGLSIFSGDVFTLKAEDVGTLHGIYDRAALIALPANMRPRYVSHISSLLPPQARGLLVTLEYPPEEMEGPPFSVDNSEVHELFSAGYDTGLIRSVDCLDENPRFRERGLSRLRENVYRLTRKENGQR